MPPMPVMGSDTDDGQFEGEVISIVVVVTNFLNILYKVEDTNDLDEEPKLQKYKFLSNYFQRITPELSQQLTSLLACVQELNAYVVDLLRLSTLDDWPVRREVCQSAEEGLARIKRCQQTWHFILKHLTTLGTKYFPDDRKTKIETRTALVAISDKLAKLLKIRGERGSVMGRMVVAQCDRNMEELARCCVAVETLKAPAEAVAVYSLQMTRCRELMRALEFFEQLRYELQLTTSSLEDEESVRNQMAWSAGKLQQSGALRVLAGPEQPEHALLALFLEPAQHALDRLEIRTRSLEILDNALRSRDARKLADVVALAEALRFGRGPTADPDKAEEEWQRLAQCRGLLAKMTAIQHLEQDMVEALKKGTSPACMEAIRHVNAFLQTHGLATGPCPKGDVLLPHRNDDLWLPAHSDLYRELCASQRRPAARQPASRPGIGALGDKVPKLVCLARPRPLEVVDPDPRPLPGALPTVKLKVHFEEDIRITTASLLWSFEELHQHLQHFLASSNGDCPSHRGPLRLRYPDDAGDLITVSTDAELGEAWRLAGQRSPPRLDLHADRKGGPLRRSTSVPRALRSSSAAKRRPTRSPSPVSGPASAALAVVSAAVVNKRSSRVVRPLEELLPPLRYSASLPSSPGPARTFASPPAAPASPPPGFGPAAELTPSQDVEPRKLSYPQIDSFTYQEPPAPRGLQSSTIFLNHPYTNSSVLDASFASPPRSIPPSGPRHTLMVMPQEHPRTPEPIQGTSHSMPCYLSPHGCF